MLIIYEENHKKGTSFRSMKSIFGVFYIDFLCIRGYNGIIKDNTDRRIVYGNCI